MPGVTIPYRRGFRLHLLLASGDGAWCKSSSGHKVVARSDVPDVIGALRFGRSDHFLMLELRALVASSSHAPSVMSDGEVLERVERLLATGELRALECGGKPSAPSSPPPILVGKTHIHVGVRKEEFMACSSQHTHEPLPPERLAQIVNTNPAGAAALIDAASRATGNGALRGLRTPALVASLTALVAGGKLLLFECKQQGAGGGGAAAPATKAEDAAAASQPSSKSSANKEVKDTALTWVRVELVDEDGNALSGEDYEISLSDGSSHKAKTSKSPFYADQIPEGVCSIRFPNLHKNYWRPPGK